MTKIKSSRNSWRISESGHASSKRIRLLASLDCYVKKLPTSSSSLKLFLKALYFLYAMYSMTFSITSFMSRFYKHLV